MSTETTLPMVPKPCTRCKGEGRTHSQWAVENGYETVEGRHCNSCDGLGYFEPVDAEMIAKIREIVFTTGKNKRFRANFPTKLNRYKDKVAARAYFVWRLARFHGGADVTLPCTADIVTGGDPCKKELDALADKIAKEAFGTNLAGAARWARAFGVI